MISFRNPASESELAERKRLTLAFLRVDEPEAASPEATPKSEPLPDDLLEYLKLIFETESLGVGERNSRVKGSPNHAQAMRNKLIGMGLVVESEVHGGKGRPIKKYRLTEEGKKLLFL